MSYGGYQQYGGNPYGSTGGSSGGYGASNPYESTQTYTQDVESARPARTQPPSGSYGQQEQYGGQYSSQGYGQQVRTFLHRASNLLFLTNPKIHSSDANYYFRIASTTGAIFSAAVAGTVWEYIKLQSYPATRPARLPSRSASSARRSTCTFTTLTTGDHEQPRLSRSSRSCQGGNSSAHEQHCRDWLHSPKTLEQSG